MTKAAVRSSLTGFSTPELLSPEFHPERRWYACRTHARAEKKVDELLGQAGLETYLPLIVRERQWADRSKRVAFPLFPGYTFAKFDLNRYHEILSTPGLATIVTANGQPSPVQPEELEAVRLFAGSVEQTGIEPNTVDFLEPGDPVRVTGGPFAGLSGLLLHRRGPVEVAIRLTSIRQAWCIVLDPTLLQRVK